MDGTTLKIEIQEGTSAVCLAYRVSEHRLARELNHPLAGHVLTLSVRVTDVAQSA